MSQAVPVRMPLTALRRWQIAVGYLAVVLIWGTTWFAIRSQLNGTAPHVAVAMRIGAASLLFFLLAWGLGRPLRLERRHAIPVLVQGICFFGLNYAAVYAGEQYLTSGVVAVIFSVSVPFNIVGEWVASRTRPRIGVVAAALIGMIGIALVFSGELERAMVSQHAWWGAGLIVFAAAIVAVGNVLATRIAATEFGAVRLNAYGMAVGATTILLWGYTSGAAWSLTITPAWLAGYGYLVLIGSVLAFWIYMRILPAIGSVAGAYVVVLSPIVAIGISVLFEALPLRVSTFGGIALLLIGHSLLVTQWVRRGRARS
jgi:drug/metabolite transporter (DMT)-like permease